MFFSSAILDACMMTFRRLLTPAVKYTKNIICRYVSGDGYMRKHLYNSILDSRVISGFFTVWLNILYGFTILLLEWPRNEEEIFMYKISIFYTK